MKKLFLSATIVISLLSINSMAKTEGNYLGVTLNKSISQARFVHNSGEGASNNKYDESVGLGVNYCRAFNSEGLFIAPGITYETIGAKISTRNDNTTIKLNNLYGIKTDFGYDVSEKVSLYVPLTFGKMSYKIEGDLLSVGNKSGATSFISYGLGASIASSSGAIGTIEISRIEPTNFKANSDESYKVQAATYMLKFGVGYHF